MLIQILCVVEGFITSVTVQLSCFLSRVCAFMSLEVGGAAELLTAHATLVWHLSSMDKIVVPEGKAGGQLFPTIVTREVALSGVNILVSVQILLLVKYSATYVTHVKLCLSSAISLKVHGCVVVLLLLHGVELTVLLQVVLSPELVIADITLVHLLTDVVPHVQVKAAVVNESLATVATFEGPFSSVYSLVNLCGLGIGKILAASFTRERFNSTVHPLVLEQATTLRAAVVTHVTLVRLLSTVDSFMSVVIATGGETFPTVTLEGFVINMFPLVHQK